MVVDGDLELFQSNAILRYLGRKHGTFYLSNFLIIYTSQYIRFWYWSHSWHASALTWLLCSLASAFVARTHNISMGGSRGGGDQDPLKNLKNIGFLSNTGPDSLKITKQHLLKIMGKKKFTIVRWNFLFIYTCELFESCWNLLFSRLERW